MGSSMDKHYVYYVSDMENSPWMGRLRKMDAGREIARYICKSLKHAKLMKYIEYDGGIVDADTIGIVFPTHMWGSSLAVYSFLRHLRTITGAYVYAVAVGETLSGDVTDTVSKRINSLEEFRRIFVRRGLGTESDIYVRCIDKVDEKAYVEDKAVDDNKALINGIMEKLFYNDMNKVMESDLPKPVHKVELYDSGNTVAEAGKSRLGNVFLDDDMLSGVRLCRAI